jgi:hypothetical protein
MEQRMVGIIVRAQTCCYLVLVPRDGSWRTILLLTSLLDTLTSLDIGL